MEIEQVDDVDEISSSDGSEDNIEENEDIVEPLKDPEPKPKVSMDKSAINPDYSVLQLPKAPSAGDFEAIIFEEIVKVIDENYLN